MRSLEVIGHNEVESDEEEDIVVHGMSTSTSEVFNLDPISLKQTHQYVLLNMDEVHPWV